MLRLGGKVLTVNESSSSVKKGESLADTLRCMECYADAIVLRHPVTGSAALGMEILSCPLINAGDGIGEHPTQALLDLYTIYNELKTLDLKGKIITFIGDLKHGRTVHSLAKLLAPFQAVLQYVSPPSLSMPKELMDQIEQLGGTQHVFHRLDEARNSDVLYVTRIQKERFENVVEYEQVKGCFVITVDEMAKFSPTTVLMHPLPRVDEIDPLVDTDPRAAYFRQMRNGMYIRMALLTLVLGKRP